MKLTETFYLDQDNGLLIEFASLPDDIGREDYRVSTDKGAITMMSWGENNTLPVDREKLIMDNNIMGELIATKRSIIIGQGLKPFKKNPDPDDKANPYIPAECPEEVKEWMINCEFEDKYIEEAANQLLIHANIPAGMVLSNDGSKITSMMSYKCRDIRAESKEFGKPVKQYFFGDFAKMSNKNQKNNSYTYIPRAPKLGVKKQMKRGEVMLFVSDTLLYDGYYGHPTWWGGKEWVQLANMIPQFHISNLSNGYVIRYHIQIPKDAFLDKHRFIEATDAGDQDAVEQCKSDAESQKKAFIDKMNLFLAGKDNVGRAIYTFFEVDEMGKKLDGVKIEPISADLKDESLLKLFEKSNQANISSMGVHPTLANVETQGKLSSGSEMRNGLEVYVKVKAPAYRRKILKPWMYVWRYNKWDKKYPEIQWGFGDIILARLDDDKSGSKESSSPDSNDG